MFAVSPTTDQSPECYVMKTANLSNTININPAILPNEELRQLVFQIILRDRIEPFVRQMVTLLDSLKAGQTGEVAKVAEQSADPAFVKLMSALSDAIQEGELVGARITAFLAAGYAYQESLDYYWDLMSYLDRFREDANKQTCDSPHPPHAVTPELTGGGRAAFKPRRRRIT